MNCRGASLVIFGFFMWSPIVGLAADWACESAWRSLPAFDLDPEYQSPTDMELVYDDRHVRYIYPLNAWRHELATAARNYVQMKQTVVGWNNQLSQAEQDYWKDFDDDGVVSRKTSNEFGYWLYKRELWTDFRSSGRASMQQNYGADAGKIWSLLLGGDGDDSFLSPGGYLVGLRPHIDEDISNALKDGGTRSYFAKLVQYSFLLNSRCAPGRNGSAGERIHWRMLFPAYDIQEAETRWQMLQAWGSQGEGRLEKLDKLLNDVSGSLIRDRGVWEIIQAFVRGEVSTVKDVEIKEYYLHTSMGDVLPYIHMEKAKRSATGFTLDYTDEKSFPRDIFAIRGATFKDVQACVAENWDSIREYYYDETAKKAMWLLRNPTMDSIQYKKHLAYVAVVGCGSPEGLEDERVKQLISVYAN